MEPFIEDSKLPQEEFPKMTWRAAPLARLQRVPEAFRDQVRVSVEAHARSKGLSIIEGQLAEEAFVASRQKMCPVDHEGDQT